MKFVITAPNVVCSKCGSKLFKEVAALKRISMVISPTGKDEIVPFPMFVCANCGEIPEEYKKMRNYKLIMGESENEAESDASKPLESKCSTEKKTSSGIILEP